MVLQGKSAPGMSAPKSAGGNITERAQKSRQSIQTGVRTQVTLEMKRAEKEREGMHARMQEVTHLKSQLMHRKYDEIVKSVVAPERHRALRETEEVTTRTLCAETLPMEGSFSSTELTDKDQSELERILDSLQLQDTEGIADKMVAQEQEASLEIHAFAHEASMWATDRQDATQRRQTLYNSRMRLPVKHAVDRLDSLKSPAEKVEPLALVEPTSSQPLMSPPTSAAVSAPAAPAAPGSLVGMVSVNIGKTVPIRLRIYGGDDPAQAAGDFCLTYRKGAKAKKLLLAAITESIFYSQAEHFNDDGVNVAWLLVDDCYEIPLDLRRV